MLFEKVNFICRREIIKAETKNSKMTLEIRLENAPTKPDAILKKISEKFGFGLGVPKHYFENNHAGQKTSMLLGYRGGKYAASASLRIGSFGAEKIPGYSYEYKGPVLDEKGKFLPFVSYTAFVMTNVGGCFSCGGMRMKRQIMRSNKTPDWFPISD